MKPGETTLLHAFLEHMMGAFVDNGAPSEGIIDSEAMGEDDRKSKMGSDMMVV